MLKKYQIVGIDEVGRGPIAGPIVSVAIALDELYIPSFINDSKKMTKIQREKVYKYVKDMGTQYGIGHCSSQEIDQLNIHEANLLCMERAYKNLKVQNCKVYIEGVFMPNIEDEAFAIKSGDKLIPIISLASVIAKVERDNLMDSIHKEFPMYGFDSNKGYCTKAHVENLNKYGPCIYHRKSFEPVKSLC